MIYVGDEGSAMIFIDIFNKFFQLYNRTKNSVCNAQKLIQFNLILDQCLSRTILVLKENYNLSSIMANIL